MADKDKEAEKEKTDPGLDLKELVSVWGPAEAEVIKSFLESQGISCLLKGLVVQSVHPFSADGLGQIRIWVQEKDFDLAKKLIESMPGFQEEEP
jgi:hypothetical protein